MLAAAVNSTIVAGENLTVGSTVGCRLRAWLPAGDSLHHASLRRVEARCSDGRRGCYCRHYLEQGASKSALARQLGVSRDTIHRWIRSGDLDRDLDADAGAVRPAAAGADEARRLQSRSSRRDWPRIRSCRRCGCWRRFGRPATRGGYSQLKAFVRQVRPSAAAGAGGPLRDAGGPASAGRLRASSDFRGACGTRCSSCSATRGCCGAGSIRARTCGR